LWRARHPEQRLDFFQGQIRPGTRLGDKRRLSVCAEGVSCISQGTMWIRRIGFGLLAALVGVLGGWSSRADSAAGASFDLQKFIDTELKAGKQRIVVPPGRY